TSIVYHTIDSDSPILELDPKPNITQLSSSFPFVSVLVYCKCTA
ncbi:unnamed protein product, partial [Ascophyllum nodosum]